MSSDFVNLEISTIDRRTVKFEMTRKKATTSNYWEPCPESEELSEKKNQIYYEFYECILSKFCTNRLKFTWRFSKGFVNTSGKLPENWDFIEFNVKQHMSEYAWRRTFLSYLFYIYFECFFCIWLLMNSSIFP